LSVSDLEVNHLRKREMAGVLEDFPVRDRLRRRF